MYEYVQIISLWKIKVQDTKMKIFNEMFKQTMCFGKKSLILSRE